MRRSAIIDSLYPVMRATRIFSFSVTVKCSVSTTAVARRARNAITDPLPLGCTALVNRMMYVSVTGSIHNEVPVKPV